MRQADVHIALEQQSVVTGGGAQLEHLLAERQSIGMLGPHDVVCPQAMEHRHELRVVAELPAQLPGSQVAGLDLGAA